MLLLEPFQARYQGVRKLQVVASRVLTPGLGVVYGGFHLSNRRDGLLGFVDHVLLLLCHRAQVVVERFRQRLEQLQRHFSQHHHRQISLQGTIAPLPLAPRAHGRAHRFRQRVRAAG